jgi:hypothetical protein
MVAPAPAMGKTAGPYRCLAPQLVPSWTLSERTFEQCSPSPAATAAIGPCTHRKSRNATIHLYGEGKTSELGGIIYKVVLAWDTVRPGLSIAWSNSGVGGWNSRPGVRVKNVTRSWSSVGPHSCHLSARAVQRQWRLMARNECRDRRPA